MKFNKRKKRDREREEVREREKKNCYSFFLHQYLRFNDVLDTSFHLSLRAPTHSNAIQNDRKLDQLINANNNWQIEKSSKNIVFINLVGDSLSLLLLFGPLSCVLILL